MFTHYFSCSLQTYQGTHSAQRARSILIRNGSNHQAEKFGLVFDRTSVQGATINIRGQLECGTSLAIK